MDILERIKPLCSSDGDRPNIATPFRMLYRDGIFAVATDGILMVAAPFAGDLRTDGPDVASILKDEPAPTHAAQMRALREWAGSPYPAETLCVKCKGAPPRLPYCPTHERGRFCDGCDSLGRTTERWRQGLVLNACLNRILLARLLAALPEKTDIVRIGRADGDGKPYLPETSEGWVGAIMPIASPTSDSPRFTALQKVG